MPHDKLVQVIQVRESTRFPLRGEPVRVVIYEFMVGTHGPFTEQFDRGQDSPEVVNARIAQRVLKLRDTGAIGPAQI